MLFRALVAFRFQARLERLKFPLDVAFQLLETAAIGLADFHRFFNQRFFEPGKARFVVAHLRAKQNVADFIDIPGSAAQHLRLAMLRLFLDSSISSPLFSLLS